MLEDKLLIWRFNRGDKDALRRIYEKYKADLLKVAAALLNDSSAVEDIVHDVFVSFAQTTGKFRLSGSLKGYLAICIANRSIIAILSPTFVSRGYGNARSQSLRRSCACS